VPNDASASKVEISAYYEVLCPDSIRFIRTQLLPTYSHLSKIMNINLIPYGKATTARDPATGNYTFTCQHGEEECAGNIIHACSVKYARTQRSLIGFVACMMKNDRKPYVKGIICARENKLNWHSVQKCSQNIEGKQLLAEAGEKTNALTPALTFVPTVELNGSRDNQNDLLTNLKEQVCKAYTGATIHACN
ncbi:Gamma-interferon-inducible lysosomal thiol reductase, partial [Caligus rogercresseyi]